MLENKDKLTVTSIFMVPPLKIDPLDLANHSFINAYSWDRHLEEDNDGNSIYLLFKPKNYKSFQYFVDGEYERPHPLIKYDYDYSGGYSVLNYELDIRFKADYDLIREGKYSKTSEEFQSIFPKVKRIIKDGKYRDEMSLQHRIFKKDNWLKEMWENKIGVNFKEDMEVWEGFDREKETLDINNLKRDI